MYLDWHSLLRGRTTLGSLKKGYFLRIFSEVTNINIDINLIGLDK